MYRATLSLKKKKDERFCFDKYLGNVKKKEEKKVLRLATFFYMIEFTTTRVIFFKRW